MNSLTANLILKDHLDTNDILVQRAKKALTHVQLEQDLEAQCILSPKWNKIQFH